MGPAPLPRALHTSAEPDWNDALYPTGPHTQEATGDHDKETSSIGPESQVYSSRPGGALERQGAMLSAGGDEAGAGDAFADDSGARG